MKEAVTGTSRGDYMWSISRSIPSFITKHQVGTVAWRPTKA